jgi:peptidoglycan biosynthesis protein MviN/MurJ (putative lipid II flippase)
MSIKSILFSKSSLDFAYLFFSNVIKKGFGFAREIILALVFGSSMIYANFLLLRTVTDLLSQLFQGNALQASLLSKFSKLYNKGDTVSLINVLNLSKKITWRIFIVSQIIQIPVVFYINPDNFWLFMLISFVFGIIISTNFFSSIFLIIMQGKGQFKKNSIATTVDMLISTLLIYPLSLFFGVLGIALSRVFGLFAMMYKYLRPMLIETKGTKIDFTLKDINISIMLLGNFANIIMLLSRFTAGLGEGNNIVFFNYAIVLLNALLTAVILNLNTIVLRRLSIKKEVRLILFSVFSSLVLALGLVIVIDLYGFDIIQFILQRGAFTIDDTIATVAYAKDLSISFVFIFIASSLFQPFFSMDHSLIRKESVIMARILIIATVLLFVIFNLFSFGARENSLIMIYTLSILSFFLSIFASYKYFITK